jgi:hypothetical protein
MGLIELILFICNDLVVMPAAPLLTPLNTLKSGDREFSGGR